MSRFWIAVGVVLASFAACGGQEEIPSCVRDALTLESGVRLRDLECGDGTIAARGHSATVAYEGRLGDGTVFDSANEDEPLTFRLGVGQVLEGWDEGLIGMRVGGRRSLVIPPELAYGEAGLPPDVPSGATVTFEIELLGLVEPEE